MSLEKMSDAELESESKSLRDQMMEMRAKRSAISKELAFRGAMKAKAKALEILDGLTPDEVRRLRALTQSVGAGGVVSEEKFGNVGG